MAENLYYLLKSRCLLLCMLVVAWGVAAVRADPSTRRFAVNYAAKPEMELLLANDLIVVEAEAVLDLPRLHAAGRKVLAYVSAVELREASPHFPVLKQAGVKVLERKMEWKSAVMDITNPAWADFVVDQLARTAAAKGFDGFFLDTVDSAVALMRQDSAKAPAYAAALTGLVKRLHAAFPGLEIVLNRGFEFLPELTGSVDGVLVESVFRTFNAAGAYVPVDAAATKILTEKIKALRSAGMPVYVLDYLEPGDVKLADETVARIGALGAAAFLSTRPLQGVSAGPVRPVARRILVIFGRVEAESETAAEFEDDTFAGTRLQMPLEWMGYELDYLDIGKVSPPADLDSRYCGVIFDENLSLPHAGEEWYVNWILRQVARGQKMLFCGQYPLQQDLQRDRLLTGLGLGGSFKQVTKPQEVRLRVLDPAMMNYEAPTRVHLAEIEDSRAPRNAKVYLSVVSRDETANAMQFDAVYTAPWGGALLDPYHTFQVSTEDQASLFDPFAYLNLIWPAGAFPAPDATTRDGRRIFFSQIDGDGFNGVTSFAGSRNCAELVRDHILTKYPLPITASLIESIMRGLEDGQKGDEQPRLEEIARSIFALPNVQAASHSFSHPYVWIDHDDEYIPMYENRALVLKPEANVNGVDPEREVAGSIAYVQGLLPPGRQCDLMLWSGNCRPGAAALKVCRRIGVENLNGGNTTISHRHPYLSNISPRVMTWEGEPQVFAAVQNEFVYTRNWKGPFFGGFRQVIDTFTMSESPRRLKPVNLYYHFYSAATPGALKALTDAYDWVLARPLHSMTAVSFAKTARDAWASKVYRAGPDRFLLCNEGHARTWRLPADGPVPDLNASRGVTGFVREAGSLYIHTDGRTMVELVLAASPEPRLHLESSTAEISFTRLDKSGADFKTTDLRPSYQVVLAGAAPRSAWQASINGTPSPLTADAAGRLEFLLPTQSVVKVDALPAVAVN